MLLQPLAGAGLSETVLVAVEIVLQLLEGTGFVEATL